VRCVSVEEYTILLETKEVQGALAWSRGRQMTTRIRALVDEREQMGTAIFRCFDKVLFTRPAVKDNLF
jgi:hypothetical protein